MGLFDFFKSKKKGIDETTFNSNQYQTEILAFAQMKYFENGQNYEVVKDELTAQGLSYEQNEIIVQSLKQLNSKMTNEFMEELDTGKISGLKIYPNTEHNKEIVNKDTVDKYIGYGAFQMDRGDLDNALELFDKAIELDDKATLAYANKGTLFSKKGDNKEALRFYNEALKIEPNHAQILENKLDLLLEMMRVDITIESEFIDTVKTILITEPNHPNALIYICQFHLKENNFDEALHFVKKLFTNFHSETIAIHLLLETLYKFPKEKALEEFKIFERQLNDSGKYQLTYCKGLYLKGLKFYDGAVKVFEQLNEIQEFSWNYYQIAIIKNLQNKTNDALLFLAKTFELEPELKEDAKQYNELQSLWTNSEFIKLTK
jgi:tetratricopeptide (TPR) repeat protein